MSPSMNIVVVGLNHRTAPVEVRERFAIPQLEIVSSLKTLIQDDTLREAVLLSTCNRVEIYAVCQKASEATEKIFKFLKGRSAGIEEKFFYVHEFPTSTQHLYEVAAGLDSMVIGETEILGQVKESYRVAHECGSTGLALNRLFQTAFTVAKAIRTQTQIGMGSVSVGSVAVDLAGQIFGELANRTVMLIGAGEMSEATAKALKSRGAKSLIVANRSFDRAAALAQTLEGRAVQWDHWYEECKQVDIVISSTAASHAVITRERLEPVMHRRNGAPLFLIDIAVPRDIERDVSQINGVYLYDIDDLQVIADQNLAMRQKELAMCKQIVREHVDKFQAWFIPRSPQIAMSRAARKLEGWRKAPAPA
jgi:glutamyl-tRNA reductase